MPRQSFYDDSLYDTLSIALDQRSSASQFLLGTLTVGSLVIVGAVAPGLLKSIPKLLPHTKENNTSRAKIPHTDQSLSVTLYRLRKQKYIRTKRCKKDGTMIIKITAKGRKRLVKLNASKVSIKKPPEWDGLWRVLTFDIPTDNNAARAALRNRIKKLGFFQLQRSIWVYPYPCEDELLFIAHQFNVEEYIELFTAQDLLHEKDVRKFFALSQST